MGVPWRDFSGRFSPLKLAVFIALFGPALWTLMAFELGWLGPRAFNEAIHRIGLWTVRFLFIALAITPLRQILLWPRLLLGRRMVGGTALAYAVTAVALDTADHMFDLGE